MSNYRNARLRDLAEAFKALGHPHRLAMFSQLATCCVPGAECEGEDAMRRCVGDLAASLGISPSTASHHLKELVRAGLISTARRGREVHCWVAPEVLRDLARFFSGFVASGVGDKQLADG